MELIVFIIALVPIFVGLEIGWRSGAAWEVRRLLVFVVAAFVAVQFCATVTEIVYGFRHANLRLLAGCVLLALFGLTAAAGAFAVKIRGAAPARRANVIDSTLGAILGMLSGAVLGSMLLVLASLVLPLFLIGFDAARFPLPLDKVPLTVFRGVKDAEGLVPKIAGAPTGEGILGDAPSPAPTPTPPLLKIAYRRVSYERELASARQNMSSLLSLNSAFRMSQLEAAKQKAQREGKLMGFIMVWDVFFKGQGRPMGQGGDDGLAHFYQVFHNNMVLVFVRHEDELNLVPEAVQKGFFGPDEGGFAPNMAVVSADAQQYICEIPLGGNDSNGQIRDGIFRDKIKTIDAWLANQPAR